MNIGQLISGLVLVIFGLIMIVVALFSGFIGGGFVALIYGLPALIIGIVLLLYNKEDKIEQVKRRSHIVNIKKHKGGRRK